MAYVPKRGDVVFVYFPVEDDELEVRPAVVVQSDELETGLNQTLFAMITTSTTRADLPSRIRVQKDSPQGRAMGITRDSVIALDTIAYMEYDDIERKSGHCPASLMEDVDRALKYALGLT